MTQSTFDNLPLEWIRAFEAAARTGSFTAAAAETGLTQASISQRIGQLEQRLGAQLFLRGPRGVSLSVAGESWLPYVTGALDALRHSSEEIFGSRQGRVSITAAGSVIQNWLLPRLAAGKAQLPFQLTFQTAVVLSDFRQQEPGVEVRYGKGDWPALRAAPLFTEAIGPVASPALAAAADDWQDLPKIALSGPRPGWQEWARHASGRATPVPRLRVDSLVHALAAARAGLGVTLASLPLAHRDLASGALVRLQGEVLKPVETCWLVAPRTAMPQRQWDQLCAVLCDVD